MNRSFLYCALAVCLLCQPRAEAESFVFENEVVRYTVGANGRNLELVEKATGNQWLVNSTGPFAQVKIGGKYHYSTRIEKRGDQYRVVFGNSGVEATYRIGTAPAYFVVELVNISGEGIEQISLARLNVNIRENYGSALNVRWNDTFAVCVMGLSDRVHGRGLAALVYPEYGMVGQRAAIVAVPTSRLMDTIRQVELDCELPSPTIGRVWAKRSPDVRVSYLFTDLTEANVEETIRYAKLGRFGYILVYSNTWSTSLGSYPINTKNFPRGEASLKATIDKCHAAGLKVGMHMLTSFVSKRDRLVTPRPDPRLLKDAESVLAADIDERATTIVAATGLDDFPHEPGYYGAVRQGFDIQIDDEIIHYAEIGGPHGKTFLRCTRGYLGTKRAEHRAGAKIYHLCQRYGCYLVDLRTSLKDELADRVAGLINRCGFDMIYFDGGEVNSANGPAWYWVSQQQTAVCNRVQRDLLVQGSGFTGWTWHLFTRCACDDYAALAPKEYLDYHKIGDAWRHYRATFMPAELGWWGFLAYTPYHPATTPDEVEYYAVRMLALDTPVSLETNLSALRKNGRTEELLRLLGKYEDLRLEGKVPETLREKLRQGEWHMIEQHGAIRFVPIRYEKYRVSLPGKTTVENQFAEQPLRFRLRAVPTLSTPGDSANIVLFSAAPPAELAPPAAGTPMPGALAASISFTKPEGKHLRGIDDSLRVASPRGKRPKPVDLLDHRALAVTIRVEGELPNGGQPPVLNVQLESTAERYRDHYIDLDFSGRRTIVIPEPTTERMLPEFRPSYANYRFKAAGYSYDYRHIVALNFRWMRAPGGGTLRCWIERVEALREGDTVIENPAVAIAGKRITFPAKLTTEDYLEYWADGSARLFDRNGNLLQEVPGPEMQLPLAAGKNQLQFEATAGGPAELVLITLGPPTQEKVLSPSGSGQ